MKSKSKAKLSVQTAINQIKDDFGREV